MFEGRRQRVYREKRKRKEKMETKKGQIGANVWARFKRRGLRITARMDHHLRVVLIMALAGAENRLRPFSNVGSRR